MRPTPLIAITATTYDDQGMRCVRTNEAYAHAVAQAGGIPLLLSPRETAHLADSITDAVDGLVLSGGEDMDPARYGEAPHELARTPNADRDSAELALIAAARARRLPLLAICRGLQVLNVAHGGTLVQDIGSELTGALEHCLPPHRRERVHDVKVEADSRLAEAMRTRRLVVNSVHHQAARRIGTGLRVVARAPDGLIEALEWIDPGWWAAGVQWHPEELVDSGEPWERSLFAAFAAVSARSGPEG